VNEYTGDDVRHDTIREAMFGMMYSGDSVRHGILVRGRQCSAWYIRETIISTISAGDDMILAR
jgi:hypothetical protein